MRMPSYRGMASALLLSSFVWSPIASFKANRITRGVPFGLADALGTVDAVPIIAFLAFAALALLASRRRSSVAHTALLLAASVLPALLMVAVSGAGGFPSDDPASRFSLGPSFWLMSLGAVLIVSEGRPGWPFIAIVAASVALAFATGSAANISIFKEYSARKAYFAAEVGNHLKLSFLSAAAAVVPGVLLGYAGHRSRAARAFVQGLMGFVQVLPTLSLLGLIMLPLSALARTFPLLQELGIRGIGFTPAFIALSLYCLFPISANTLAGFDSIDERLLFSAEAMGMTPRQVLVKVKLPLVFPVVFSGVRTALTQSVGNATIAGLVGGGGMGTLIFLGLSQAAPDLVLLGSIPVIFLALLLDGSLSAAEKRIRGAVQHVND